MVSCLSPSPHPRSFQIPLPSCSKYGQVENYSIRLPGASSSRPSCHPRRDTSARWVSPRRTRWPPADTWRWPPSPAQGQPRPNFSCTNIGFVWVGVRLMIPLSNRCVRHSVGILELITNHFMRNMSSPVESVAPMILSGARPRAKPRSFSVWESNDKMAR